MTEPTPPPDEPLPAHARAAVVLVAGVAAWAVQAGGADPEDTAPPAAASTSSPAEPSPLLTPTPTPVDPTPSGPPSPTGVQQAGRGDCEQEMRYELRGAEQTASFGEDTSFWVKGDRFVLCDVRGGVTTVHHALPLDPVEEVVTYRVSSAWTAGGKVTWVAGGVVPEGATAYDVSYTFPDGQTVPAETVAGDDGRTWWRVVHTQPGAPGAEIDVTVSYSGVQERYRLGDADVCAQATHGC